MPKIVDLTGERFGRLVVVAKTISEKGQTKWICKCECGVVKSYFGDNLKRGKSQSCGCLRKELTLARTITHGNRRSGKISREYEAWCSMIARCENQNDTNYHNYGARGITVCKRWRDSFENFIADMGKKTTPKHSIERMNVNGNYEPSNCKWASKEEQMQNRRMLKNNSSGVKGVYLNKNGKYHAQISANSKRMHLGYFDTLEEALEIRKQAEQKHWKTT